MSAVTHCLNVGQKIGSYEVVRPLGEGAMGEVYEVVDKLLDRHAALKVIPPWLAQDQRMVTRFRREVRATCRVRHCGVVHIFDYGVLPEQNSPYFVMEYLEGETLHRRLWRASKQPGGRLGLSGLPILRQIALALAAVHRQGLVHRDLKPANVMLVADPTRPEGVQIKLLDFGIVKILQGPEQSPGDSLDGVTRHGAILGTPRYMAPEQWLCKPIDEKTDVYAMGVMSYLALSGRPPFVAADGPALGMMHCYMRAPSLSRVAPDVPRELVQLVSRMLDKSAARRPTMAEVADKLERLSLQTAATMLSVPMAVAVPVAVPDEICIEADYEASPTLSMHDAMEPHELTQRNLPITQRTTQPLRLVATSRKSTPTAPPILPVAPSPTLVARPSVAPPPSVTGASSVVRESVDGILIASGDNFKIEKATAPGPRWDWRRR